MTILIIKSFTFGVILDSGKKITSVNDSEALMTADDCSMLLKQQKNE